MSLSQLLVTVYVVFSFSFFTLQPADAKLHDSTSQVEVEVGN